MAKYIAKVKSSVRRSDEVRHLAGKEVIILPETMTWILPSGDFKGDYQFKVIPTNTEGAILDRDIRLCASHLKPLDEDAEFILNTEPPKQGDM